MVKVIWMFALVCVSVVLMACSTMNKEIGYYEECLNDKDCREEMNKVQYGAGAVGAGFGGVNGELIGSAIGGIIAGWYFGRKRKK